MDKIISERGIDPDIRVLIPSESMWEPDFRKIRIVRTGSYNEHSRITKVLTRSLWKNQCFSRYVRKVNGVGIDMLLAFPHSGVSVTTIHDCIRESYYGERGDRGRYQKQYLKKVSRIVRDPDMKIVTVSEFSRRELMRYYGLPEDRIGIIGNGWEHMETVAEDDTILEKLGLNDGKAYFFSLGSREPHKNTEWVFRAAKKNPQYVFVLTGQNYAREQLDSGELPNVIYTGYLEDGQMKSLMRHCKAFLQPSFIEGFGIPPLEALSLGKHIIVSNTSSLPEIFGDSAWYIDPAGEAVNLDELMKTPVSDGKKVLETYTWRHAAEKMLCLLETNKES